MRFLVSTEQQACKHCVITQQHMNIINSKGDLQHDTIRLR